MLLDTDQGQLPGSPVVAAMLRRDERFVVAGSPIAYRVVTPWPQHPDLELIAVTVSTGVLVRFEQVARLTVYSLD